MNGFLLIDCNSFYCSCERLFRPDLAGRPVIVLSSNDGCVVSRTPEAKALGIAMGVPYFQIRTLCQVHGVAAFSSNYELYGEMSRRVVMAMSEHAEQIEVYSIDECFLYFDQIPPVTWAVSLRDRIRREIGIPVSVGAGRTKTLSKLAGDLAKKIGVYYWDSSDSNKFSTMSCEDIWGISKGLSKRLREHRIHTVADFLEAPVSFVRDIIGVVGARIWHELQGEACLELVPRAPVRKSLCSSRTFKTQTDKVEDLEAAISEHCHRVSETLRQEGNYAGTVAVFLNTDRFRPEVIPHHPIASVRLSSPSHATQSILAAAMHVLHKVRRVEVSYRKAGVIVGEISDGRQGTLWPEDATKRQKQEAVCRAMDLANLSSGGRKVTIGLVPRKKVWLPGAQNKSPRYLADWNSLPKTR
jgi:DNA polymerase V